MFQLSTLKYDFSVNILNLELSYTFPMRCLSDVLKTFVELIGIPSENAMIFMHSII